MSKTTIKIERDINIDLMIASRLSNTTKEKLAEKLLSEGLKPYLEGIERFKFK